MTNACGNHRSSAGGSRLRPPSSVTGGRLRLAALWDPSFVSPADPGLAGRSATRCCSTCLAWRSGTRGCSSSTGRSCRRGRGSSSAITIWRSARGFATGGAAYRGAPANIGNNLRVSIQSMFTHLQSDIQITGMQLSEVALFGRSTVNFGYTNGDISLVRLMFCMGLSLGILGGLINGHIWSIVSCPL